MAARSQSVQRTFCSGQYKADHNSCKDEIHDYFFFFLMAMAAATAAIRARQIAAMMVVSILVLLVLSWFRGGWPAVDDEMQCAPEYAAEQGKRDG